jgi:ABC-type dipeptide/oligopeptide/nickel transport system permease component
LTNMEAVFIYKSSISGYVFKRILIAVIMFFIISLLVYFSIHGLWGEDHAIQIIRSIAVPNLNSGYPEIDRLIDEYSGGESRIVQYFRYMGGFFTGDWGNSLIHTTN